MNPGFDGKEIEQLKKECTEEGQSYVLVLDEQDLSDSGEYLQFQFVGTHAGKEVIYDAAIFTLELHYNSLLLDEAEKKVGKIFPDFVPIDQREESYVINPKADEMIEELIMEMEEDEDIKVTEFVTKDLDFEFGIGLEVALNVEEITPEIIEKFISDFNSDKIKLDNSRYSFKQEF